MPTCIFCDSALSSYREINNTLVYDCGCPNCGEYEISMEAQEELSGEFLRGLSGIRHLISGYSFELNTERSKLRILNTKIEDIVKLVKMKGTIEHKLDRLLYYIYSKTNYFGREIEVNKKNTAICYAMNEQEVRNLCKALDDMGYIRTQFYGQDYAKCTLNTRGYMYIDGKLKTNAYSKQCFIAMWFNEEMINSFSPYISKAVIDTGFEPFITMNKEHNDDICDEIIAGIKKSKFMIADFTGQRPSVYYEAGIAFGLGIPVIWTCKEDWFNNQVIVQREVVIEGRKVIGSLNEARFVHFDVSHNKFIVWKDGKDLYDKLVHRIEATIK